MANDIISLKEYYEIDSNTVTSIETLWKDKGFKICFEKRNLYQLSDSMQYYIENVRRIGESDYKPTIEDILRVRIPTTGIAEYSINIEKKIIRINDAGGQRSERRKWIHYFDNVSAIIYLVSLSEYDQKLYEEEEKNRMYESLEIFEPIINLNYFFETPIILFFNKKDLLEEKIKTSDLGTYFPEYKGTLGDYDGAKMFIKSKFTSKINNMDIRPIYCHFICATDTENIRIVGADLWDAIIWKNLRNWTV